MYTFTYMCAIRAVIWKECPSYKRNTKAIWPPWLRLLLCVVVAGVSLTFLTLRLCSVAAAKWEALPNAAWTFFFFQNTGRATHARTDRSMAATRTTYACMYGEENLLLPPGQSLARGMNPWSEKLFHLLTGARLVGPNGQRVVEGLVDDGSDYCSAPAGVRPCRISHHCSTTPPPATRPHAAQLDRSACTPHHRPH